MNDRRRPKPPSEATAKLPETSIGEANPTLWDDAPPAAAAITSGVERAAANASDFWWSPAMQAIKFLADGGRPFECYDLTLLGVPDPDEKNRWGGLFQVAHKAGIIEPAGYTQSRRPGRAGGLCRVWRGAR